MDLGLRGRVALVTAASRGLGRAIAEELSAEGASLVICARNEEQLERTRREIAARTSLPVAAIRADVSNPGDVARVIEGALGDFKRIDILVTNAGGPPSGPFESHGTDAWDAAYRLTLASVVNLCRGVLPGMKERRWGRILNVTSIAAKQPVDNLMLSNSLRAAVTGFARTLANEVAPFGITVNNILPGYTRTERVEELAAAGAKQGGTTPEAIRAKWEAQIPMGRLGEPREFAALAAFLASDRASYLTAQNIAVDGGWVRALV
jgi:3-oxoacyl-[acyl-carrier protein] reductase